MNLTANGCLVVAGLTGYWVVTFGLVGLKSADQHSRLASLWWNFMNTPSSPTGGPKKQESNKIPVQSSVQHYTPQTGPKPDSIQAPVNSQPPKPIPIPKGMPTITENHKQTSVAEKKPFKLAFLAPKYWGIWLLLALVLPLIYLPLRIQFWIGRKLGIALYHLVKSRRNDTLVNLELAFPEKMAADRELMAKQVFVNQGIGVFETLCAWFRPNVFTRTVSISGLHHLVEAKKQGKAVLLLGGHYTMLDLGGRLFAQFSAIDCVYRPQNNELLDWFIYNGRRHIFDEQIDHHNMRKLVSRIREGSVVWYSPDQDYGLKHGVMAPFFGVPAATVTAPRRLARMGDKSNPPAVMALHTYRQTPDNIPRGKRPHYHLSITPALEDYPTKDEVADATRINEVLESLIRIDPTQWMWFHKRYKNGEEGRTSYYNKKTSSK